ncbi:MAG TPA: glycogen-binding domain-containing protein, partial [Candidatus Omnitrophota bacterium]|nr:glycogen-binding domain-containing protein [Candidatus Omnitrophota bacterium]
ILLMEKKENEPETVSGADAGTPEVTQVEVAGDVTVSDTAETPAPSLEPFSERMQETVAKEVQEFFPTRFMIEAPGAKSVYVTGSFNDWSLDDGCRLKEVNGQWEVQIPLKPGSYKYQFIVDGVWKEDPSNPRRERNSFGDINSLIEVTPALAMEQ